MAGFRIGRGGPAQQQPQPRHPAPGRHPGGAQQPGHHQQPGPGQYQQPGAYQPGPYASGRPASRDDAPGHTRAFTVNVNADGYPNGPQEPDPYGPGPGYGQGDYRTAPDGYGYVPADAYGDDDHVNVYQAGRPSAPPVGPRLPWQQLLTGILVRPGRTFLQMRDYQVWGPALLVTFVYGLLAVFGFDSVRSDVLGAPVSQSIPWVVFTSVAVVLMGLVMGSVTHTLARQFGGDGNAAPTIGLAMLVASVTDVPRLVFALFLGGGNEFVQVIGWISWAACAALLTSMVSKSHDLPWPKALGAATIQLIALLVLFKLPTL